MLFGNWMKIGSSMLFILTLNIGCATVPKQSVELSNEIGKGISESRRSHVNLLNAYFAMKKAQIDQWIESEYLPEYIANIQDGLKKMGKADKLDALQLKDILRDVVTERDQKNADLEKTRIYILEKVDGHYDMLLIANSNITALLQSLVDVKEATTAISGTVKTGTGGKIDLGIIEQKFSTYLKQAGSASNATTSLYEQVKQLPTN